MRESLVKHQIIQYRPDEPFYVGNAFGRDGNYTYIKCSHWHEELEIAYIVRGQYRHYIDGEYLESKPGQLVITNCESVHRIEGFGDDPISLEELGAIVLIVHNRFIEENFPAYHDFWFTNEKPQTTPTIRDIMLQFSEYANRRKHLPHEHLYMRGLLLQLLFHLYQEGNVVRSNSISVKQREQVQVLKEILQYVENHYREPIVQSDVAEKFYFTPQYFAQYFKKHTGTTFTEHLMNYRLQQAKTELLHTDHQIGDIARNNGFYDDRRFINAFKKIFHATPLQYRKATSQKE